MITITQRCCRILKMLCGNANSITARQISEELNVSERTIRYDISLLGDWLLERGVSLISTPKKGFCLKSEDKKRALSLIPDAQQKNAVNEIFYNSDDRVRLIVEKNTRGQGE